MNNYKYHFHFITFDIETFNLENFKYNFVNMTAYRMVDIEHPSVRNILKDMEKFQPMGQHILNKTNVINVSINYFSQNFKLCYLSSTLLCLIRINEKLLKLFFKVCKLLLITREITKL